MKRIIPFAACAAGIVVIIVLMPWFNATQRVGAHITRGEAEAIADAAARQLGIPVDQTSANLTWTNSAQLEKELENDPARQRSAQSDPVIGPRLGAYRRAYYRPGRGKVVPWGDVTVDSRTGEVLTVPRRLVAEDKGANLTEAQLRPRADQFVHSRHFTAAPNPQFESARPTIGPSRTDR